MLSKSSSKTSDGSFSRMLSEISFQCYNLTLGISRSPRFLVLYSEIMDLSENLRRKLPGQRICKILFVFSWIHNKLHMS